MPRKMRVARAEEFWVEALVADSQRVKARVRAVEKLGGQVVIGLDVKDWVGARSGQFAMLQPVRSRCFLPRAFSVFTGARGGATGIVNFLIAPVGRGTEELAAMREGEEVWVLGRLVGTFLSRRTDALWLWGVERELRPLACCWRVLPARRAEARCLAMERGPMRYFFSWGSPVKSRRGL